MKKYGKGIELIDPNYHEHTYKLKNSKNTYVLITHKYMPSNLDQDEILYVFAIKKNKQTFILGISLSIYFKS